MAKILVVDDNPSILQLVKDFFAGLKGHSVYTAENAADALQLVRERQPDLALLDIMMPGGGYCFAPTHQLQDNSPTENVVAMYETAKKYGTY